MRHRIFLQNLVEHIQSRNAGGVTAHVKLKVSCRKKLRVQLGSWRYASTRWARYRHFWLLCSRYV